MHRPVKTWTAAVAVVVAAFASDARPLSAQTAARAEPAIVAYRKALMNTNAQHVNALRAVLEGGLDLPDVLRKNARALAENGRLVWAQTTSGVPDVFPVGSTGPASRATASIWDDRDAFVERARAFRSATGALDDAARRGDRDAALAALGEVRRTCASCHERFRGPAPQGS